MKPREVGGNQGRGNPPALRRIPERLGLFVAAHVWQTTPGLSLKDNPAARKVRRYEGLTYERIALLLRRFHDAKFGAPFWRQGA